MTGPAYITRLERAKMQTCPYGVAPKCLGDGCAAWEAGGEWRSVVTGEPDPEPEKPKTFLGKLWAAVSGNDGGGIRFGLRVEGVEHGHCARVAGEKN